jgi:hypothetical protein
MTRVEQVRDGIPGLVGRRITPTLVTAVLMLVAVGPLPRTRPHTAAARPCLSGVLPRGSGMPAIRTWSAINSAVSRASRSDRQARRSASLERGLHRLRPAARPGLWRARMPVMWQNLVPPWHRLHGGCNGLDITCTVMRPRRRRAGSTRRSSRSSLRHPPTRNSRMFLLYTPPTVYPVRLMRWIRVGRWPGRGPRGHEPGAGGCDATLVEAALASNLSPTARPCPSTAITSAASCPTTRVLIVVDATGTGAPLLAAVAVSPNDHAGTRHRRGRSWRSAGPASRSRSAGDHRDGPGHHADRGRDRGRNPVAGGALERLTFADAGVLALTGETRRWRSWASQAAPAGFSWASGSSRCSRSRYARAWARCRAGRDRWHG